MSESTCPKPDCIDTPLVSAASITGIITFIYAVLAGLFIAYLQTMTIDSELDELVLAFESTERQLQACRKKMNYFNEILPKDSTREELYHLYGILRRGEAIMTDPQTKKMVDKITVFGHFNKFKRLGSILAGRAMKDTIHGKLKSAQGVLSEIQLGLIQLKQDVINADQIARSNALLNMMLDSSKRPNIDEIQRSVALFASGRDRDVGSSGGDRSPPDFSENDYPFGPRFQTTPGGRGDGSSEAEKSTVFVRTQLQNEEVRRSVPGAENEPAVDPLGTLMRARTMSIAPGEMRNER